MTGFTDEFYSVAAYERIDRDVLQRRLLLALFALGTNMGIRAIVATGEHGESEAVLRHVRRHFITVDNLRAAVTRLVNGTFAAGDTEWWGRGTACASDSKKFGFWSSNFMTEYHARYGGNGVMIYCHVERKNVCIYSQLKSCSSSEVAAMIEGPAAALHGRRDRGELRRHARRLRGRLRAHRAAQVPAAAPLEEHRQHPPVPPG
ncbi:transposase [Streptomyces sp. NBC_01443]|nr:transposase [Streptomyces sp. NBC_01443]